MFRFSISIIVEKKSAVRSRISSKRIFASCVGYFDLVQRKTRMRCGLLYFEVLLLVAGVRTDPKYLYSYI